MKKVKLKKLIYKNYLKTALSSILFIEVALLILYFNVNSNIIDKSINFILSDIKLNVSQKVESKRDEIQKSFINTENLIKVLQSEHQNFFNYYKNIEYKKEEELFDIAQNGMLYKSIDNKGSSVIVSNKTKITDELLNELYKTEIFDASLKTVVNSSDIIVAAYFNSKYNYSRYYPFIKKPYEIFPSDIDMTNYNFYYMANENNNPKKDLVWTDVYLDPAGQGWMLSAIAPIYKDNTLEGVSGIDITINKIIEKLLNIKVPYDGKSFLMDKKGNVIAMNNKLSKDINLPLTSEITINKKNKINHTILKINHTILKDEINLIEKSKSSFSQVLKSIVSQQSYNTNIKINKKEYLVFSEYIDETTWHLVTLINKDVIINDVKVLKDHYKFLGYFVIILICLFYFIFFIYLYNKSKEFVNTITKPLSKIIALTKNVGNKSDLSVLEDTGIEEIDELNSNFNNMVVELDNRTKKLVDLETKRAFHEKLSNTDELTGAYNRRYLYDFVQNYMKIVKREKKSFSLLILDIDDFKQINDNFGHNVGDNVLKFLVNIINKNLRNNDIVVRLGGDEFLILLPETNLSSAKGVANKLIKYINSIELNKMKDLRNFTLSIGVSEYSRDDDSIDDLIKRADKSLYKAKSLGKNRLV